jgi:RNA polymerase sigma-70 factor (ECF subfamily)
MSELERHNQFAELLKRHHSQVFGYVLALVHSTADAEDILQQASLTMWEKFDQFDLDTNFGAWACSIARYKALNWLKARRRHQQVFTDALEVEVTAAYAAITIDEVDERTDALRGCVEELPPDQQKLLYDCYDGERAVAGVAEQLGRTVHSIHSSLRNIRHKLAECIRRRLSKEDRS